MTDLVETLVETDVAMTDLVETLVETDVAMTDLVETPAETGKKQIIPAVVKKVNSVLN
jgi:hypothetical protein